MAKNLAYAVAVNDYSEHRILSIWDTKKDAEDECIRVKEELSLPHLNIWVEEHPFNTPNSSNYWNF